MNIFLWVIAILALLLFWLFRLGVIGRKREQQLPDQDELHLAVEQLQEQLEDTADCVVQNLEQRAQSLEHLIKQADEKISCLETLLQRMEQNDVLKHSAVSRDQYPNCEVTSLTEGQQLSINPHQDKHRLVYAMASQGYDVTEIAKSTGLGKGEVMLLLQLQRQ